MYRGPEADEWECWWTLRPSLPAPANCPRVKTACLETSVVSATANLSHALLYSRCPHFTNQVPRKHHCFLHPWSGSPALFPKWLPGWLLISLLLKLFCPASEWERPPKPASCQFSHWIIFLLFKFPLFISHPFLHWLLVTKPFFFYFFCDEFSNLEGNIFMGV